MSVQKLHDMRHGRRTNPRIPKNLDVTLRCKDQNGEVSTLSGATLTLHSGGISCRLDEIIPAGIKQVNLDIQINGKSQTHDGRIVWVKEDLKEYGIKFKKPDSDWDTYVTSMPNSELVHQRRQADRRSVQIPVQINRRREGRRYEDLLRDALVDERNIQGKKVKAFLRSKSTTHSEDVVKERREWLEDLVDTKLKHIAHFDEDASTFKGKIENVIGVAHVPLGLAGPLKVNGEHARETYFIPLATTEGALVTSYTLGSYIATRSGGAHVRILKDELRVGPMFVFASLKEVKSFETWLRSHFQNLKETAEKTSKHLKLKKLSTVCNGRRVIVNFHYTTGDAMGMNMACKATDVVCRKIRDTVRPEEFWLRSNYNANKKVSANNFINGYGKTLTADVTIPRKLLALVDTTPEQMERYFFRTLLSDAQAAMVGGNGHFANLMAALFIACGQDVASIATSHVGISTCETTKKGDLYFSVYISNLLVGTVGGGTNFGTSRECLEILGCYGNGKANKFAEIIGAAVLAGEIAICASIVNGTYVMAHETFGRNRP